MIHLFAPGSPQALVLLGLRMSGLVLVAPVFSSKTIPTLVKTGVIVLLTVLLQPLALAGAPAAPQLTAAAFVGEIVVGLAIGLGAAVLVGAATLAGDVMGLQIGLSGAAVLDPTNNTSENVLGTFSTLFAITMLFAVDAHLVMIDAVAHSLRAVPVGSALHANGLLAMVHSATLLFALGLQFAAPVAAAVLVANTALAILTRAAPQLNVLSVAFPVQIGLGLLGLGAAVPFVGAFYRGWTGSYSATLDQIFSALARGGRPF